MRPWLRTAALATLALVGAAPLSAQADAIRSEILGFYRDDRAHRWPDVLSHFWVGKITARWVVPTSDTAWRRGDRPPVAPACDRAPLERALEMSIVVIDDRWARVWVMWCGVPPDELWMLRVGEQWKIARLMRGS